MPKMTFNSNLANRRIKLIERALTDQKLSLQQLCEAVFLTRFCCRTYINHLKELKKVHLCKWRRDEINGKKYWVALYTWGEGKDAKRPPKEPHAQRQRRKYKERKKNDPVWHMQMLAKQRARRIKPKQDIASSWIIRP